MKLKKDIIYEYIQREAYASDHQMGFRTEEVAAKLEMQRSNVSTALNDLVKEGLLIKSSTRPVSYQLAVSANQNSMSSCFDKMIGCNGSLKNAVDNAKAAILYPNHSFRIMLNSPSGCGTTMFSRMVYEYAVEKKVLLPNAPYVKLNCLHYGKNVSVLDGELFGLAGEQEKSCFNRAQGGVLFIDNVQLLDARQQGRISEYMETSRIYSDDRTMFYEYKDIMLVLSSPEGHLPAPFFTMGTIHLPSLAERSLSERFELINYFFANEAQESKTNISVTMDTARALALAEYPGNVKQMANEIKAACAKAYVRTIADQSSEIDVVVNDLEPEFRKGLLDTKQHSEALTMIAGNAESLFYDKEKGHLGYKQLSNTVYESIRRRTEELSSHGIGAESISGNAFVLAPVKSTEMDQSDSDVHSIEQLSKVVDLQLINVVSTWFEYTRDKLDHKLNPNVFYGLCLHVNALVNHKTNLQRLSDERMNDIVRNHQQEFNACLSLASALNHMMHVDIAVDDIAVLAQFLIGEPDDQGLSHPVLLYIFHGTNTASSLRDVTNDLTHLNNAFAYDLNLNKDTHQAMEEIKRLILRIDNGEGVLVIYDMGSIKTVLETIEQEINVRIRYLNMPVTLVGLSVARKCAVETDIDYIYHSASTSMKKYQADEEKKNEVIVTLCQTGEGGALELKHYIDQYSHLGIRTVAMAFSNRDDLIREIGDLRRTYHIYAFVGTFDPKVFGIPFISISRVFNNPKEYLDQILNFEPVEARTKDYEQVYKLLADQFHYVSIPKLKKVLPEVVDELGASYGLSDDQKDGVFMHLACSVERLMSGQPGNIIDQDQKKKVLSTLREDYALVTRILRKLERSFNIMFSDDEIATVIMILKRI